MNKTSIKIIKRKDAEAAANDKTQNLSGQKLPAAMSGENIEPRLHRKMADTVSNWIAERRENKRSEEVSAFRKLFGDEFLSSKTA
ncbi:MAG: hypothetical protein H0U87_09245 [Acidobacteria bacterium]|nr:hypothetical protein [Acidobacteriota bacterium]